MTRPVPGLALAALFGLSLTVPCLAMGLRDELPMQPMAGCADGEAPRADLVCTSSFKPAPSHEALPPTSFAVVKIPAKPPVELSAKVVLDPPVADSGAREHAPPAYLLHNAFLI